MNLRENFQIELPLDATPRERRLIDDINRVLGVLSHKLFHLPVDSVLDDNLSMRVTDNLDGTITLSLYPSYDDLNIGSVSLGAGATAPDLVAFNGGTILVRCFDGLATTEQLFAELEITHAFSENTLIVPHLHWCPTTADAGNVVWQLTYNINFDSVAPVADVSDSITVACSGVAWQWKRSDFAAIRVPTIHAQMLFRLFRNPGHASDSYGADAGVATFGIHLLKDSLGSREIMTK